MEHSFMFKGAQEHAPIVRSPEPTTIVTDQVLNPVQVTAGIRRAVQRTQKFHTREAQPSSCMRPVRTQWCPRVVSSTELLHALSSVVPDRPFHWRRRR